MLIQGSMIQGSMLIGKTATIQINTNRAGDPIALINDQYTFKICFLNVYIHEVKIYENIFPDYLLLCVLTQVKTYGLTD